jgi:hypothetical protein
VLWKYLWSLNPHKLWARSGCCASQNGWHVIWQNYSYEVGCTRKRNWLVFVFLFFETGFGTSLRSWWKRIESHWSPASEICLQSRWTPLSLVIPTISRLISNHRDLKNPFFMQHRVTSRVRMQRSIIQCDKYLLSSCVCQQLSKILGYNED